MSCLIPVTIVLICGLQVVLARDLDPIHNFCRRFAHQTAFVDNKLYIDGGYVDYGTEINSATQNYTNTFLLYADTSTAASGFPVEYNNLSKPGDVPSVAYGALWADEVNKRLFLFGGELNTTAEIPSAFSLWSFDTIYNNWSVIDNDPSLDFIKAPSFGASAVDQNSGVAYSYGGFVREGASNPRQGGGRTPARELVRYDMVQNQWKNVRVFENTARSSGALFYIPASDEGMLVYFGGVQFDDRNNSYSSSPMNNIYLYDIRSQKSYQQLTSGISPSDRQLFCGGVSWPEDRSSYNIYVYGGLPAARQAQGIGFTDVWILSLPSFTWTQYADVGRPHHSTTCNMISKGQMIVMGGYFPNSSDTECDVADSWGIHNLNLGRDNRDKANWYQFLPNLTTYTLPDELTSVVGGSSTGGATLTTPSAGFSDPDLAVYFTRKAPTSTRTATRGTASSTRSASPNPASTPSNTGAIAGGVVGGIVGLAIIVAVVFCCLRRRRRQRNAQAPPSDDVQFSDHSPPAQQSQPYYPPPVLTQPYYPPPPKPQQSPPRELMAPMHELPNVRSPVSLQDLYNHRV